ncbi:MAG: glutaredoxin family protein [Gammaproteobacteria bacterium]
MDRDIVLYTTPGCPDCAALKAWLGQQRIPFRERDLSQPGVADEAKSRYGVRVAPVTVIGDAFFYGTFAEQQPKIRQVLGDL